MYAIHVALRSDDMARLDLANGHKKCEQLLSGHIEEEAFVLHAFLHLRRYHIRVNAVWLLSSLLCPRYM
jgi:hypothetical protein